MTKTKMKPKCFECNAIADHNHHVIPRSKGGTKMLPLCSSCHGKVHDSKMISTSELTKAALAKLKARGVKLGAPIKNNSVKIQLFLKYRSQGKTIKQISELTGVSTGSVCRLLKVATHNAMLGELLKDAYSTYYAKANHD